MRTSVARPAGVTVAGRRVISRDYASQVVASWFTTRSTLSGLAVDLVDRITRRKGAAEQ